MGGLALGQSIVALGVQLSFHRLTGQMWLKKQGEAQVPSGAPGRQSSAQSLHLNSLALCGPS